MNSPLTVATIITTLVLCLTLSACGKPIILEENETVELPITRTKDLVVSPDFDFRLDKTVTVTISQFPSDVGKVNIYNQYEYHDVELNRYYPDYATLIASYIASSETPYLVQIDKDLKQLVLEWLPMDGKSDEQYLKLDLSNEQHYVARFIRTIPVVSQL